MPIQSVECSGSEMIDLVRRLKSEGHLVSALAVGKKNADWIVEYYPRDAEPKVEQAEMFS